MKTILIVDDEAMCRDIYKAFLEDDYQLTVVTNAQQGLDYLQQNRPDLILLDHLMPGMDGMTFCKMLKSDTNTRNIPVIFVSADCISVNKASAQKAGADDFLHKPYLESSLLELVKKHIA